MAWTVVILLPIAAVLIGLCVYGYRSLMREARNIEREAGIDADEDDASDLRW